MKKISIMGIGVISNLGNDVESIWNRLCKLEEIPIDDQNIKYQSILSPVKRRRMNRYSDMTLYSASKALEDGKVTIEEIGESNIGTIYNTGYGPLVSNLKFADTVIQGDPDMCSPTIFANTVSNACVGNVCISLGTKGVSTIVMGSSNLSYSQMLISKGDADYILTGSIEEYCEELVTSFKNTELSKNVPIKESAVTFLVKKEENTDKDVYAHLIEIVEGNLGVYPLIDIVDEKEAGDMITEMAEEMKQKYQIDTVFTSCNGTYFDEIEKKSLFSVLKDNVVYVNEGKKLLGETLGASFQMNVLLASLCLKNGFLPVQLDREERNVHTILVSGYDVSGNYSLAILQN